MAYLLLVFFLGLCSPGEGLSINGQRNVIATKGDIILGGLCPFHYPLTAKDDEGKKPITEECKENFNVIGLQHAEAILYAVDQINQNPDILPGVRLGVEIRDTCNSVDHAIRETLQFSFVQDAYRSGEGRQCMGKAAAQNPSRKTVAIIGAAYSGITMAITSLAGLFYIPVVSYASTSRLLEDQSKFKYFLRTVPSDNLQAQAMVAIIKEFKWNFVSTIASDTEYGRSGIDAFRTTVNKLNHSICIVVNALFTTRTGKSRLKQIIHKLRDNPKARVIVLFAERNDAVYFINTAKEENLKGKIWIGSDAFAKSYDILKGNEDILEHWISTSPENKQYQPFKDYYLNLTRERKERNPWLSRYSENLSKQINSSDYIDLSVYTITAIDAVYAVAYGLHAMYKCTQAGCSKNETEISDQSKTYEFIKNVSFISPTGNRVLFDSSGSAGRRYIITIRHNLNNKTSGGESFFSVLGKWNLTDGFTFSSTYSHSKLNPFKNVSSSCSVECQLGYRKTPQHKFPKCCWECSRCRGNSMTNISGLTACITCPLGTRASREKSSCDVIEPTLIIMTKAGLAVLGAYTLGMLVVLGTMAIFIKHSNSPVVRASSKELSYVILCGIAVMLTNSFIVTVQPTTTLCQIRPFLSSIGMAMVIGSLLSKTNRISRIFSLKTMRTGTAPHFVSKKWQFTFVCVCVLLGNAVAAVWVVISPFKVAKVSYRYGEVTIECSASSGAGFATWATYHVGLTILCTYQAFLVRKVPENYNEAKFIAFTMVTLCLSGAVYVPTYYGTHGVYRVVLTASLYLFCSYSTLFCLFGPKLYIILFRPEKNQPLQPRVESNRPHLHRSVSAFATSSNSSTMATNDQALSFTSLYNKCA